MSRQSLFKDEMLYFRFVDSDVYALDLALEADPHLIDKMRDKKKGILLKDRWKTLKLYKSCFTGKEAIDWFIESALVKDRPAVSTFL